MSRVSGNRALNYTAGLNISEFKKSADELKKIQKSMGAETAAAFGTKPMSAYREAQLKMQESLRDARLETERLKTEAAKLRAEVEAGRIAQQSHRTETDKLKASEQALRVQLQQGRISQQQYNTQVLAARAAQQGLNSTLIQSRIDAQNARTGLAQLALQQRQLAIAAQTARASQRALSGSYQEAQQRLTQLGNQIRNVSDGFASQSPLMQARIREYNQLNERLKAFDATMGNHQRKVGDYRGAMQGVGNDLASMASGYLSAGAALQYVLKSTMEFQRIKTPLTYILGSEGDANNKLQELKKLANELGIEYFALSASYKSFSAAARASNFDLVQSEKIFTSVTKASAVLGLSSDQLQGALTAIQQMISKGNVQAEELRGQLAERLPGAFALSAKAMGVTEKELNKLLQTGQVTANELLPKLALELDKNYGDKAADGIKGLNAEMGRFWTQMQSFAGESSALSTYIFEPIVRGASRVFELLNKQVRGSFTENIQYMFSMFNNTRTRLNSVYDLRESNKNNKSALQGAKDRDLGGAGLGELKTYYSQVDQTFKKAAKDYEIFKKGIADGSIKETTTANLASYARLVEGLSTQRNRIGSEIVKQKQQIQKANKDIKEVALTSVEDIRKAIIAASKVEGSAIVGTEAYNKLQALKSQLKEGTKTIGAGDKSQEVALSRQRTLQAEIDALTKKGVASKLDADQQEIVSVEEKYRKLREKAIAFNNAKDSKGQKVNLSGLNSAELAEKTEIIQKKEAKDLKEFLDEQANLYTAYEDLKIKIGKEKADERYKDQIDISKTYLDNLYKQEQDMLNPGKAKGGPEDEVRNKLALIVLQDRIKAQKIIEQKAQDELLAEFMSYQDKRTILQEKYRKGILLINDEAAKSLYTEAYETELNSLDDTNVKKLDSYKRLFEGVDNLSDDNARKVISDARKMLETTKMSAELRAEIDKLLGNTSKAIKDRLPEGLISLANEIDRVANAVGGLDSEFGKVLSTLGNVVGQVGNIKKGMLDFKAAQGLGDGLGQLTAGLGIFSAAFSLFKTASDMFGANLNAGAVQREYANKLQGKQLEAINKALERQVALINEAYGTDKLDKYNSSIAQAIANEKKYLDELKGRFALTGDLALDEIIKAVNSGSSLPGMSRDFVIKSIKLGGGVELPKELDELQRMLDEELLDESTALIVSNLIKAVETSKQLANNLKAETIGTSLDSIADSFVTALTDGTEDFGKTFEDIIKTSIVNGFKSKLIEEQLQPFYDLYGQYAKDGLDATEIEKLKKMKEAIISSGEQQLSDLEKVAGTSLKSGSKDSSNSLAGAYTTASQESISLLAGQTAGMRLAQIETNNLLRPIGKTIGDFFQQSKDNFGVYVKIEQNTANTVVELKSAVTELKGINNKMSTPGNAAVAAGYN